MPGCDPIDQHKFSAPDAKDMVVAVIRASSPLNSNHTGQAVSRALRTLGSWSMPDRRKSIDVVHQRDVCL